MTVAGALTVSALTDARISAIVSNTATSAPAALFGAGGMSASFILASNMVSSVARAYLEDEPATVQAGDVTVAAANAASITADTKMYAEVSPTNDAGAGILNTFAGQLADEYQYTSNSGPNRSSSVRRCGSPTTTPTPTSPASSSGGWARRRRAISVPRTTPTSSSGRSSRRRPSSPTPCLRAARRGRHAARQGRRGRQLVGLLRARRPQRRAERRRGYLDDVILDAASLTVSAVGAGWISAADESVIVPWEGFGALIVTNVVLAATDAYVVDSDLTTSGDIVVDAQNTGQIDATSTSRIEAWTAISAVLVFNSIGWKPSNILFNAVDALLGDPLISSAFNGEQPAYAQAYIRNTPVDAGGALTVTAVSAAQLNAVAGNENVAEAAVDLLFMRAGQKGDAKSTNKSKKLDGYGASGLAGGGILASNKVSSFAKAFIEFTAARGVVTAVGAVTVAAQDTAGIDAQSTVLQEALTSNTLEGVVDIVNQFLIPGDYAYTTASGTVALETGQRVRLGAAYAGPCPVATTCGDTGAVYEYMAADAMLDLGAVDFTTADWRKLVGGADNLENLYPGIGNFTDSDARAVGILIVMNDLRSSVEAFVRNVELSSESLTVSAIENALLKADAELNVTASGGSFYGSGTVLAVGGQIVTNVVLAESYAYVVDSVVGTTAGDVAVTALNTSGIDARSSPQRRAATPPSESRSRSTRSAGSRRTSSSTRSTRSSATR